MIEISVSDLTKEFEVGKKILDGLTFQIDSGERVGILGKNGAGKSTVFRILTGEVEADGGEVAVASGKKLGLISQIPVYPAEYTVKDVLKTAFRSLFALEREMEELAARMATDDGKELLRRYDGLMTAFEAGGGYETDTRLDKVCNGLSIPPKMRSQLFSELSGGEKTRVNLARLILEDTDILLLDEPTNHLDLRATQWLEEYLSKYKGTVLTISHDRYFLDRVISRVIELKDGKAEFYGGNYSFYAEEKEKRYLEKLRQYEKEQAKLEQLQTAADQLHLWAFMGSDKLHNRAFSLEKRMEKLKTTDRPTKEKVMKVRFGEREFRGDDLLQLRKLEKSFDQRTLFYNLNLKIEDGDRIALLGDNGTGKSTLLKIIMGEEKPDGGKVKKGPTVTIGYLPQQIRFDHPERDLVDTMLYSLNCTPQEARNRLAAFQFQGDEVFKQISTLSGGELSRLRLCMLMDAKINLLILDEPTNHLDLASREWIESAVEEYEGTLLFVSHDRYFIDRFATRIWALENGGIRDFQGNYTAYQAMLEREKELPTAKQESGEKKKESKKRPGGLKQLKKELSALEKKIEQKEEELKELNQAKEEAGAHYKTVEDIVNQEFNTMVEYEMMMTQWEALMEDFERREAEEQAAKQAAESDNAGTAAED